MLGNNLLKQSNKMKLARLMCIALLGTLLSQPASADGGKYYLSTELFLIDSNSRNEGTIQGFLGCPLPGPACPVAANDPAIDIRPGKGFAISLGKEWENYRIEISFSKAKMEISQRNEIPFFGTSTTTVVGLDIETYLISGYTNVIRQDNFNVFAGIGAGVARWSPRLPDRAAFPSFGIVARSWNTQTDLALSGMLGIDIEISDNIVLSPNYRLTWINADIDASDFDNSKVDGFIGHSAAVGMRYKF